MRGPSPLWIVFVAAFALRVGVVLAVGHFIAESSDKLERYDHIAFGLMRGEGFSINGTPTAVAGPLYPMLLAALYALFGYSATAVRIFLSFLDAANCAVFYSITRRSFGGRVPVLTALALIGSPLAMYCILIGAPEIPFLLFHSLFLLYLVAALHGGMHRDFLVSGMALGVATLTRAVPILLPLVALPAFVITARRPRRGLLHFSIFLLGFTLLVAPWISRNYLVFQRFIPVQTLGGSSLYLATRAPSREDWLQDKTRLETMKHAERDQFLYLRALKRISNDPATFVRSMSVRFREMWYRTDSRRFERPLAYASAGLLILAAAGMILSRRRWREHSLFYLVIAYYIILHSIMIAILRYTLPIIPLITAFAMVPIGLLLDRAMNNGRAKHVRSQVHV